DVRHGAFAFDNHSRRECGQQRILHDFNSDEFDRYNRMCGGRHDDCPDWSRDRYSDFGEFLFSDSNDSAKDHGAGELMRRTAALGYLTLLFFLAMRQFVPTGFNPGTSG